MLAEATLATNPLFRYRLAEADAHLRAADALLQVAVASAWSTAVAAEDFSPEQRARIRATATWITGAAAEIAGCTNLRRCSPDVVQEGPNTRQNRGAGRTRDQHETTRFTTPLNLQNLHPRFKSLRRLQSQIVSSQDTGDAPALAFARSRSYGVCPSSAPCGRW